DFVSRGLPGPSQIHLKGWFFSRHGGDSTWSLLTADLEYVAEARVLVPPGSPLMPASPNGQPPHVALTVNKARSYGRGVLQGVADYVQVHGPWSIFLDPYADGTLHRDWLRRWRGDGILAYAGDRAVVQRLLRCGIPCVEIYGVVEDRRLPRVGCDDRAIGRLAARHLMQRELKRFAYCGFAGVG